MALKGTARRRGCTLADPSARGWQAKGRPFASTGGYNHRDPLLAGYYARYQAAREANENSRDAFVRPAN
jgi:hypothetical protein